jgi:hypothetical protein
MNKFDKVLKHYLNEDTVSVDTDQIKNAEKKMGNDPAMQKLTPVLTAQLDALDTDKIHKGLNAVIDPNHPSKFNDEFTNDTDKEAALKHLADQGVPIGNVNNDQNKSTDQQQKPSDQQNQKNPTQSISNSTNTSSSTGYGAGY